MKFKKLSGETIKDLGKYVIGKMIEESDPHIYVGCDSKVKEGHTYFIIVIVLRYPGRGAHVLYREEKTKKFLRADLYERLWKEIEFAVSAGISLREKVSYPISIHVDISPNEENLSSRIHASATGYLKGMAQSYGLDWACKPEAWAAMRAADMLTRHNRYYYKEDADPS